MTAQRYHIKPGSEIVRTNMPLMGVKATAPSCPMMRVRILREAQGLAVVDYFGAEFTLRRADLTPIVPPAIVKGEACDDRR